MNQLELTRAFREGKLSAKSYISKIESFFEQREPSVLAFIPEEDRFERLRKEAETLLSRFPDPSKRPPLFGMLFGVKDIFHADGFVTQAGSKLPADDLQGSEAVSVTRLKNAGALVMGKTITTEFAYFFPGSTRNPHNPNHTPGGSSSGSAAAVGAELCSIALGTQTIGSLVRPAAFCGVVTLKPTYDRISRDGVIPLSPTLDHIGIFTPDVSTVRQVAPVVYQDWKDSNDLDKKPILGIPKGDYLNYASDYALTCFNIICDSLSEAGYELSRVPVMDDYPEVRARHDVIMSYDAANVHEKWFEKHADLYSPRFTELIQGGQSITDVQLQVAMEARDNFRKDMAQTMDEYDIDVWIAPPAVGPAPNGLEATGDPVMNLPWTQIGFPAMNIPTTKNDDGLPMGLQLIGKWNSDEALLSWAKDIEKVVRKI
ncbi:MAG TPA: amidase [Anaerolineales bacterium]|nr:amidase [Anaerolineales bacterium]